MEKPNLQLYATHALFIRKPFPELESIKIFDQRKGVRVLEFTQLPYEQIDLGKNPTRDQYYQSIEYKFKCFFDPALFLGYAKEIRDKWAIHKRALDEYDEYWKNTSGFRVNFLEPNIDIEKVYELSSAVNKNKLQLQVLNDARDMVFTRAEEDELTLLCEVDEIDSEEIINKEITLSRGDIESYFQPMYYGLDYSLLDIYLAFTPVEKSIRSLLNRKIRDTFKYIANHFKDHVSHLPSARGNLARVYGQDGDSFNKLINQFVLLGLHHSNWMALPFINKWIQKLNIEEYHTLEIKPFPDYHLNQVLLLSQDKRSKAHLIDVGYGTLQLITILIKIVVEAGNNFFSELDNENFKMLEGYKPHVILIEEPELNLHPNWQSLLADIFLDAAKEFNTQFIIETHSEYLIRRFQNLVVLSQVNDNGLILFYINGRNQMIDGSSQVERIPFLNDGSLDYQRIGKGFFDEHYNLTLSLLNIRRDQFVNDFNNLKRKIEENSEYITKLENEIDRFTDRQELSRYQLKVEDLLGGTSFRTKISPEAFQYLASARFLFDNLENQVDYSPIVIQCGRAVEKELTDIFRPFRENIRKLSKFLDFRVEAKSKIKKNKSTWFKNLEPEKFVSGLQGKYDYNFNEMQKSIECLLSANATEIILLRRFRDHISSIVQLNHVAARSFIDLIDFIRKERNRAGHVYSSYFTRLGAREVLDKTEEFFKIWVSAKI